MGDQDWTPVTVTKTAAQRNIGKSTAQAQSQVRRGSLSLRTILWTNEVAISIHKKIILKNTGEYYLQAH